MDKEQVSQDTLYEYMQAHGLKMTRLAQLIGKSDDVVTSCFKHHKDVHGRPRSFNDQHLALINEALPRLADELLARRLEFGKGDVTTNRWGNVYDPSLIEPINELGVYMNVTALVDRVLGWKKGKKSAVFCQPSSKAYGCISKADATAINTELLAVAGVLSSYEVVADDGGNSEPKTADSKEDNKGGEELT